MCADYCSGKTCEKIMNDQGTIDHCLNHLCHPSSTCSLTPSKQGYVCHCQKGRTGMFCETGEKITKQLKLNWFIFSNHNVGQQGCVEEIQGFNFSKAWILYFIVC